MAPSIRKASSRPGGRGLAGSELRPELRRLLGKDLPRGKIDGHAVLPARIAGGQLLLEHILQDQPGIAGQWITPSARAREEMAEHVALPDLQRALARQLTPLPVGVEDVVGGRARPAPCQAVGQKAAAIGPELERPHRLQEAILADDGQAAAMLPRPARVWHIAIALDAERILGLDHLDRVVGEVDHARAAGVHAVLGGPPAPGAEEKLEEDERSPLAIVAAEADARVAPHLAGEHTIRRDLGEGAEEGVGE